MKNYEVSIETETVGEKELTYLYVFHQGNHYKTGVKIDDPIIEIPLIIETLVRHLVKCAQSKKT